MIRLPGLLLTSILTLAASLGMAPIGPDSRSQLEIDPQGWQDLLEGSGSGLKGWTRVSIPPTDKLLAESPWKLDSRAGVLFCDGPGLHEWLRFDTEFANFVYHVEWRFVPVTQGKKGYNSGIYVRNSSDGEIWHQAQTGGASGGFLFGSTFQGGKVKRVDLSKSLRSNRVKPAGEWNVFEITCQGKDVSLWANGDLTCVWNNCEVSKGFVGLEAEGYQIEFRRVLVKKKD